MSNSQYNDCFELGRLVRAQSAAFNDPHYDHVGIDDMDINLHLHVLPLENATPLCSDLLPPKTKEVDSAIEYEVASEDGVLEMDDELRLFRVDSSPSHKRLKSFSKPLSLDMEKKKKKFKKLIGKLSRERRHAETTRIKQQRRKSNPFSKSEFYFDDDIDIVNYQETSPSCVNVIL